MVILKTVSDLDPISALADTDLIAIRQLDGITRKVNIAQIQGYGFVLTNMIGALNGVPSLVNGNIPDTQINSIIVRSPQLTAGLALKADQTALTSGLALKADQTALTSGLALKADQTALTSGLALKADQTALTSGLALKADQTALTSGLALKADQTALTSGLALKADQTALTSGLALKIDTTASVDKTSAQTISGVKTFSNGILLGIPLPINQGGLGSNTVINSRSNLGIFGSKYLNKSANYTILDTDSGSTIDVDSSAASCIQTLPAASVGNVVYVIRKTDASVNTVTIAANGTDLINGSATYVLTSQNQTITLISRNASFWIVQNNFAPNLSPSTNATQLQSKNIAVTTPLTGQTLVYNGTIYTPRVAGKILQVVNTQTSTPVANTAVTYVSTGLTATITPLFTTSVIAIFISVNGIYKPAVATYTNFRVMRNVSINLNISSYGISYTNSPAENFSQVPLNFMDSPASISAQTYTVEFNNGSAAGALSVQYQNSTSSMILMEIAA